MSGGDTQGHNRTIGELLSDLPRHLSALIRKEFDLLRAELSEKVSQAGSSIGMIVAGAVIALVALNLLAIALVAAIATMGLAVGWAALIVGGALLLIALILVGIGRSRLKPENLLPRRTVASVEKDATRLKEGL